MRSEIMDRIEWHRMASNGIEWRNLMPHLPCRRTFIIAAMVAALLVAVSGGIMVAHLRQAQASATSQSRPATTTQQTNPGMLALSGTPQTPGATYRKWKLVSFTFAGRPQTLGSNITAEFIFDSHGFQALAHVCNSIGERYTWSQDHAHLVAQGFWQTLVLCAKPGLMNLETNYLAALRLVTTYHRDQSGITLQDDAGLYVLRYVPVS
jgi:heat shock protein HslJ